MSAHLLQNPGKFHILKNDLESFLHVLSWMTLCYIPTIDSYASLDRTKDLQVFNEHVVVQEEGVDHGGCHKHNSLYGGTYPSQTFQPRKPTLLLDLLMELSTPFQISYSQWVPSAED